MQTTFSECTEHVAEEKPLLLRMGRMAIAMLLHGLGSGAIGIVVSLFISHVQIIGFGRCHGSAFLDIATSAPGWRRMLSVSAGGLFGAVGWYWLRGREPLFVPIADSMKGAKMPVGVTVVNAMIQDIAVALGGSFGREAAPRELCAMWGGWLSDALQMSSRERTILVASGTGAGLAAVYSVPISGAFYTIEHMLDWDLSVVAVVPAIVTSFIATAVSSLVVETEGLYEVPRYSYGWPMPELLLWSALIGPVAGIAAACFVRLVARVRVFRPLGRVPVTFDEACTGCIATISLPQCGTNARRTVQIIEKTENFIRLRCVGTEEEFELEPLEWSMASPEGQRDWNILIAMPAAFLVLALLSVDYPSLLGNGRALAQVAIFRQRDLCKLTMLFFLKVLVTVAAIASGVDGGTLTPSVALGATLGAVLGSPWIKLCPGWAPHDSAMSIVSAAAFLAAAMKSPATGFWLLMEFAAQGIRRQDLAALCRGDFSGLVHSKLAVGMALPMAIAVAGAMSSFTWYMRQPMQKAVSHKRSPRNSALMFFRHVSSQKNDLDLAINDEHFEDEEITTNILYYCFLVGLRLNAVFTLGIAAAEPSTHEFVTKASCCFVPVAVLAGIGLWLWDQHHRRYNRVVNRPLAHVCFEGLDGCETTSPAPTILERAQDFAFVAAFSAFGALVPLLPWALRIWRSERGLTTLFASAACAVAGTAVATTVDAQHVHGQPLSELNRGVGAPNVAWQTAVTGLSVSVACLAGVAIAAVIS
mmetsp:Transcript_19978/g.55232  ORF Transcript_19978/g.55232 Transcript_19978/m.55232 type:complete len:757 (-) Transcript_19978:256-2526(-)